LSTLTKVLIILLTLSSIFLCGIVVTYVASVDNFKQKYDTQFQSYQAAIRSKEDANRKFNELQAQTEQEKLEINKQTGDLKNQARDLEVKLAEAQRQNALLLEKVNNWTSAVTEFSATNDRQGQLLQNTLNELNRAQTELEKEQTTHNETTSTLVEKMAVIALLEDKTKRLTEEKTALQTKLDQLLRQFGKAITTPAPVTAERDTARLAVPMQDMKLKGSITVVDMKNKLAQISIGSAHGVKEGTRFHAIRGDTFVCDIVVFDVQPEKAVGILDLIKPELPPRTGDQVSTNM
jgi:hypothetical protein